MSRPVIVIVGAGPGVSGSVARRFAGDGYDVGLIGTNEEQLGELTIDLEGLGAGVGHVVADITDADAATAAVREFGERLGRIDVLHFNPSAYRAQNPLTLTVPELLTDLTLGVGALLTCVQAARPFLTEGGRITATGSMAADQPSHEAASLGVQKAGLRNLIRSIDATLADDGIRAVSVTVCGTLAREGAFTPDRVAEAIHGAAHQDVGDWRAEVRYEG